MRKMTWTQFKAAFHTALEGVGNDFVNELVRTAPVDTSFLRQTIRYEVVGNKLNIHMPDYAFYVEFGTGEFGPEGVGYWIRAKPGHTLHWIGNTGKDCFAKAVYHHGQHPQPFIRAAINTKLRDIVYINLRRQLA